MSDVFREVDEDIRQEQYQKLWKSYGRYIIAGVVIIVLAAAGTVGWRAYKADQRSAESARFESAVAQLEAGEIGAATEAFATIAGDSPSGYAALAQMRRAAALVASGDDAGALAAFEALSESNAVSEEMRTAALMRAALLRASMVSAGDPDPRLQELADSAGPWRALAREVLALHHLAAGNRSEAIALLTALTEDATASPGIRSRSAEVLGSLRSDGG